MSSPLDDLEYLTLDSDMPRPRGQGRTATGQDTRGPPAAPPGGRVPRPDRMVQALDIVSSFHSTALPSNFRRDEQVTLSEIRNVAACTVPLDLEATVLRLAVNAEDFFKILRAAQPPALCAAIFFQKLGKQTTTLFQHWDIFCRYGPHSNQLRQVRSIGTGTASTSSVEAPSMTMSDVVNQLRKTTSLLEEQIEARKPHGIQPACDLVFQILNEVIMNRNRDAFTDNTWNRRTPRGESDEDRNLYHQLIVAPHRGHTRPDDQSSDDSSSSEDEDEEDDDDDDENRFFALPALEALPVDLIRPRRTQLNTWYLRLEAQHAPRAYRARLSTLLDRVGRPEGGSSRQSANPPSRPGSSLANQPPSSTSASQPQVGQKRRAPEPGTSSSAEKRGGTGGRGRGAGTGISGSSSGKRNK